MSDRGLPGSFPLIFRLISFHEMVLECHFELERVVSRLRKLQGTWNLNDIDVTYILYILCGRCADPEEMQCFKSPNPVN